MQVVGGGGVNGVVQLLPEEPRSAKTSKLTA